jgi:transcription elongation factor Elf1
MASYELECSECGNSGQFFIRSALEPVHVVGEIAKDQD